MLALFFHTGIMVNPRRMDGGNKVIGLWHKRAQAEDVDESSQDSSAFALSETSAEELVLTEDDEDEVRPTRSWSGPVTTLVCSGTALGWIALTAWNRFFGPSAVAPTLDNITSYIAGASAPVALIGVVWLMLRRSSQAERRRFAATVEDMRVEQQHLETTLGRINDEISASRERLSEQTMQLLGLGDGAAGRISQMTSAVQGEIETINRQSELLRITAAAARSDVAVLLSSLPKAQVQARQMVTALQEAATSVHERAGGLDAQLSLLIARGREADEIAGGAAQKLAAHLSRVEGVSETAGTRLEEAAGQMTTAVDAALERAAEALNSARVGMEAQGAAMLAMVEQSQAATAQAGHDAAEQLNARLSAVAEQSAAITQALKTQNESAQGLKDRLEADIRSVEEQLSALETTGEKRVGNLAATVGALRDNADSLGQILDRGSDSAKTLIDRSEGLLTALDAVAREIDETLPAAYDRLAGQASETLRIVEKTAPQVAETAKLVETTASHLSSAEQAIDRQQTAMAGLSLKAGEQVAANAAAVADLSRAVRDIEEQVEAMTAMAGPRLVEALLRVRETATQAADHARMTLATIIPESAAALGEQSKEALSSALTAQVEAQMAQIAEITETAVGAAQAATDRLMRQMLTISETSATLEKRIAEAKQDVEASDHASLARRVALLIESLNSTAIDVTKVLSNEVTDSAWAAYLRGDRGIFARRAVRLLDATEVKEVLRHYEEEAEFREHVNRYIHDFEAMLRNVLSTRDGSPLGVTLLSSDNGKLYVALAQAIERLRS